jgi:hypothetical protein
MVSEYLNSDGKPHGEREYGDSSDGWGIILNMVLEKRAWRTGFTQAKF